MRRQKAIKTKDCGFLIIFIILSYSCFQLMQWTFHLNLETSPKFVIMQASSMILSRNKAENSLVVPTFHKNKLLWFFFLFLYVLSKVSSNHEHSSKSLLPRSYNFTYLLSVMYLPFDICFKIYIGLQN